MWRLTIFNRNSDHVVRPRGGRQDRSIDRKGGKLRVILPGDNQGSGDNTRARARRSNETDREHLNGTP